MTSRWKQRPEGSNWGDFGDDDELGRLNFLTPNARKRAAGYVKEGLTFCLSLPLNLPGGTVVDPRRSPPRMVALPRNRQGALNYNYPLAEEKVGATDIISDDAVTLATQYSTHWDTFAHVGQSFDADGDGVAEPLYYNGWRAGTDVIAPDPATGSAHTSRLGADTMARVGLQGRGVMVDLCHHFGHGRRVVGYDDIMRILDADDIEVEPGDLVCLYSGFGDLVVSSAGNLCPSDVDPARCVELDGRDQRLLKWIDGTGLTALISDNIGIEAPSERAADGEKHASWPLHELCLFKIGIALGELWYLSECAMWMRQRQRRYFLLTAAPLCLPGAVGSPVTPIATV
ncbi:cyclase (plasmid) [Mesorhizobium sp. 131-3-5]|uniref:cyclase family protein n=1 Tax=Mesorhizobium sp. 131-3-5 TaxID=2744520 RepID=UPI0018EB4076|nr:cyclase family protein [Mesorhizobium sp. 131-3-5]BCH12322.1 cyclase [Mesorhizobium sp. 131-3-5]